MNDLKLKIFSSISKEATPIYKVAQDAGVCITTASKYCYILQAEKKIDISNFGNMKLVKKK